MISRVMMALALLVALVAPSIAQGSHPAGRIAATFYQVQAAAQQSKAVAIPPDNVLGAFRANPEAPIHVEADTLVEVLDGARQALFSGNVKLQQGDFILRTTVLTAFYSGQSGLSSRGELSAAQLTRAEARERVLINRRTTRQRPETGRPSTSWLTRC